MILMTEWRAAIPHVVRQIRTTPQVLLIAQQRHELPDAWLRRLERHLDALGRTGVGLSTAVLVTSSNGSPSPERRQRVALALLDGLLGSSGSSDHRDFWVLSPADSGSMESSELMSLIECLMLRLEQSQCFGIGIHLAFPGAWLQAGVGSDDLFEGQP